MQEHKIFTYADPYKITEASFWEEIKDSPHLCSSRALVEGLTGLYGKGFAPCVCTVEDVLEEIYPEWLTQTELQIKQRVLISNAIDELKTSKNMKKAFKFNKSDLLKAVRFLCEMGIDADTLASSGLVPDQIFFVELYRELIKQHNEDFSLPKLVELEDFVQALVTSMTKKVDQLNQHIELLNRSIEKLEAPGEPPRDLRMRKRNRQGQDKFRQWLEAQVGQWRSRFLEGTESIEKVVFHGIHLFTPMRVKLIQELKSWGVEVVFLHNYAPEFPNVYLTWDRVYGWTDAAVQRDMQAPVYQDEDHLFQGRSPLGEAMGNFLEGKFQPFDLSRLECQEFDNNTSLANYAGDVYEHAKKFRESGLPARIVDRTQMDERFYSADYRPVNEIVKMYYPELYGDRHFLAFPIGQLVMSLYHMWDEQVAGLKIKPHWLKECFNSNLFIREPGNMHHIIKCTQLFFQDTSDVREYCQRLELLAKNVEQVNKTKGLEDLKMFSFYHITRDEIMLLQENLSRLNDLACELFADTRDNRIDFKKHFEKLLNMIEDETEHNQELDAEERSLLYSLMERFENLNMLSISGSVEDLKESIHYYLKQKESMEEAGWLVSNFEQIEGDVLLSKSQAGKMYHFSGLSEKNMQVNMNDRLPWPLTEEFFTAGYDENNLALKIVLNSMKEYKNFLRYALFFGVYYLRQPFRLSFVKHEDDQEQQPWFLLNLLGLEWEKHQEPQIDSEKISLPAWHSVSGEFTSREKPDKLDCQTYVFCPVRFVLDRVLSGGAVYHNEYLCSQYYTVLLYEKLWERLGEKGFDLDLLAHNLAGVEAELKPYFPFWRSQVDFADKRTRVKNWVIRDFKNNGGKFLKYNEGSRTYLEIKKHFIYAKITDKNNQNLLADLHRLRPENPNTRYRKAATQGIKDLLHSSDEIRYNIGPWCEVCKVREVCLESYKKSG